MIALCLTIVGVTCIAKPNPPKKYEAMNKGKGGAGAWIIHETSWETCPGIGGSSGHFLKAQFLTKHNQFSESEIRVGEVNVQHRATNETLDP